MKDTDFNDLTRHRMNRCGEVLMVKAAEYATEDRLHNFKVAAALMQCTPERALLGMWSKHVVSVVDLVKAIEAQQHLPLGDKKAKKADDFVLGSLPAPFEKPAGTELRVKIDREEWLPPVGASISQDGEVTILPPGNGSVKLPVESLPSEQVNAQDPVESPAEATTESPSEAEALAKGHAALDRAIGDLRSGDMPGPHTQGAPQKDLEAIEIEGRSARPESLSEAPDKPAPESSPGEATDAPAEPETPALSATAHQEAPPYYAGPEPKPADIDDPYDPSQKIDPAEPLIFDSGEYKTTEPCAAVQHVPVPVENPPSRLPSSEPDGRAPAHKKGNPLIPHSLDDQILEQRGEGKSVTEILNWARANGAQLAAYSDVSSRLQWLRKQGRKPKGAAADQVLSEADKLILKMADGGAFISEICIALNRNFNENLTTGAMVSRIAQVRAKVRAARSQ